MLYWSVATVFSISWGVDNFIFLDVFGVFGSGRKLCRRGIFSNNFDLYLCVE